MNNKHVQYAIELSKCLNFSTAAEKLGISQPALSKQILCLEKEIGTKIFERRKNSLVLTAAGTYFLREAQNLLYREGQLFQSMEKFKTGELGRLVIGISPFRSLYLLPPVIKKLKKKYPGVEVILQEDGSDQLRKDAAEGIYDFAIVNLPVDESALSVIPIEQDTLVLAVPKSIPVKASLKTDNSIPEINIKDCCDIPFIVVSKAQEMRQLFDRLCSQADITPNITMEVVGLSTAWAMARSGIGATILPLQFIKSMNYSDEVNLFLPKCEISVRQPAIVTKHGQYLSEYTRYAIKLLTSNKN